MVTAREVAAGRGDAEEPPPFDGQVGARSLVRLAPGVLLLLVIGLAGKWAQTEFKELGATLHTPLPDVEYVLWAILIGLVVVNTVGVHAVFRPGVATYEFWLKVGIVLLGARFLLLDLLKLGGLAFAQILVDMVVAGAVILAAARAGGLSGKLALGHAIGLTDHEFGLWAGLAVDNTAETTATGYLYSDEAGKIAVLVKSVRNGLIGFVVLGFAAYWAAKGEGEAPSGAGARARFLWQKFPKFVLGFVVVAVAGLVAVAAISLGLVLLTSRALGWYR